MIANTPHTSRSVSVWIAVTLSISAIGALWINGNAQALRLAIPASALIVGLVLYQRYPLLYVRYSLWTWFLAPLIRRVVDWQFGFVDPNFVLLTPFLVSGIAGLTIFRTNAKADNRGLAVFISCITAILYGFVVGLILQPPQEILYGLVNWMCPLLFGLQFYLNWDRYEEYRTVVSRSLLWMVLLVGTYGVFQFLQPPAWDRYWLENILDTNATFGIPEPLKLHVWSTLNGPAPFANIMMVGLLLLANFRSRLKLPAVCVGYLSLLFSTNRTAWIGWAVGLFVLLKHANPKAIARVVLSVALVALSLMLVANDPRVSAVVGDRIMTFVDLRHDVSFGDRSVMYQRLVVDAFRDPFGHGFKNVEEVHGIGVDSQILHLLFQLGWLGCALFLVGMLVLYSAWEPAYKEDSFLNAANAALAALLFVIISEPVFVSVTGAMFWTIAGMYLAGIRYHRNNATALTTASRQNIPDSLGQREVLSITS